MMHETKFREHSRIVEKRNLNLTRLVITKDLTDDY